MIQDIEKQAIERQNNACENIVIFKMLNKCKNLQL